LLSGRSFGSQAAEDGLGELLPVGRGELGGQCRNFR
jgi:hypothetical protein